MKKFQNGLIVAGFALALGGCNETCLPQNPPKSETLRRESWGEPSYDVYLNKEWDRPGKNFEYGFRGEDCMDKAFTISGPSNYLVLKAPEIRSELGTYPGEPVQISLYVRLGAGISYRLIASGQGAPPKDLTKSILPSTWPKEGYDASLPNSPIPQSTCEHVIRINLTTLP